MYVSYSSDICISACVSRSVGGRLKAVMLLESCYGYLGLCVLLNPKDFHIGLFYNLHMDHQLPSIEIGEGEETKC